MSGRQGDGLRTPSLRRRTTAVVLVALAVMLVVLVAGTDRALDSRLEAQLRDRMADRAAFAADLADDLEPEELVDRLEGDGISVVVTDDDGERYTDGPLVGSGPPPPPGAPGGAPPGPEDDRVVQDGGRLALTESLGEDGSVTLLADTTEVQQTLTQVRVVLVVTALLVLLLAAAVVPLVVSRALAPLDRITEVARSITRGDRGRRLDPRPRTSELGRTATAFDEMLDEVVGAEQQARASERRLRGFLSDAAHDLRTPLTGVQAAAEHVLREDPPREERERVLTTLVRETRRASRLVDDMLLMTTIEQGLQLRAERVDLLVLARDVAAARELAHPATRLEVAGASLVVAGDRDRLSRALGNLVDNALRHAVSEVAVSVLPGPGGTARVEVRDDGPGVPPAERERIFDRMVRLDDARTGGAGAGGAGLGLPIARGIARAHGGEVACADPGAPTGARFVLTVPTSPHGAGSAYERPRQDSNLRPAD